MSYYLGESGEMNPQLRALAALPEDPGSPPSTHMTAHACLSNSRGSDPFSGHSCAQIHMHLISFLNLFFCLFVFLRLSFSVTIEPVLELALVDHAGFEPAEICLPASASRVLGLKACTTTTRLKSFLKNHYFVQQQKKLGKKLNSKMTKRN